MKEFSSNLENQLDKLISQYEEYTDIIMGCAFVRDPFCYEFTDWAGLNDEAAYLAACKAFMKVAHKEFRWGDYLEARTTAEKTFRLFYEQQHYPIENVEDALNAFIVSFLNQIIDNRQIEWEDTHPGKEMPEPAEDDIDNLYLARVFSVLPNKADDEAFFRSIGVEYNYEQLHMCCWFSAQVTNGAGQYSRGEVNFSARTTYNRLLNYSSLLWIGAVLGADRSELTAAAREAEEKKTNAAKCGVIRKHVPFDTILALFHKLMDGED